MDMSMNDLAKNRVSPVAKIMLAILSTWTFIIMYTDSVGMQIDGQKFDIISLGVCALWFGLSIHTIDIADKIIKQEWFLSELFRSMLIISIHVPLGLLPIMARVLTETSKYTFGRFCVVALIAIVSTILSLIVKRNINK